MKKVFWLGLDARSVDAEGLHEVASSWWAVDRRCYRERQLEPPEAWECPGRAKTGAGWTMLEEWRDVRREG